MADEMNVGQEVNAEAPKEETGVGTAPETAAEASTEAKTEDAAQEKPEDAAKPEKTAEAKADKKPAKEKKTSDGAEISAFEAFANLPFFRFFLNSNSVLALVGKVLLLLVFPYAYIWIGSAVCDGILHWARSAPFLVISAGVLLLVGLALSVWAIVRAVKNMKAGKTA